MVFGDGKKILILSSSSPYKYAGVFALDVYRALISRGHEVQLITKEFDPNFESGITSLDSKAITMRNSFFSLLMRIKLFVLRKLSVKTKSVDSNYFFLDLIEGDLYYNTEDVLKHMHLNPDVILFLFPQYFLKMKNLFELNQFTKAPILFVPVDMEFLTGGCHYFNDCTNFLFDCSDCPAMLCLSQKQIPKSNLMIKRNLFAKFDAYILANRYVLNYADKIEVFKNRTFELDMIIDEKHFDYSSVISNRAFFDLEEDKIIFLVGAASLNQKRKGFSYLIKAFQILFTLLTPDERDVVEIALIGNISNLISSELRFKVHDLGYLELSILPKIFQASDAFINASIQDAGPMMVSQSLMCGTPVVCFEIGVAVKIIVSGENGFKVSLFDYQELAKSMLTMVRMSSKMKKDMRKASRESALKYSSYSAFNERFDEILSYVLNK